MFCGSCMQDNTLVRSLRSAGADAVLIPTYTPIRVDEVNSSTERVFLGGINIYLDSKVPGWRHIPRFLRRWLDRPAIVSWLSRFSSSTNARDLGSLTLDLLNGAAGPQASEIRELIDFLCDNLQPDIILFSNALLSGVVPELRQRFRGRLYCLLQGDDIFLDGLPEPWRARAIAKVSENAMQFDGLLTHSHYYATLMQTYLNLPSERFQVIPLSIEDPGKPQVQVRDPGTPLTVGYFARICPEKGAFQFLEAAEATLSMRSDIRFVIGGFLPEIHRQRFEQQSARIRSAFGNRLLLAGSPGERAEKFRLIQSFDWLCVPTMYREPKGLYVLEAALCGVPSLVPAHGAFPELLQNLDGGLLFSPDGSNQLTKLLESLAIPSPDQADRLRASCLTRHELSRTGSQIWRALAET